MLIEALILLIGYYFFIGAGMYITAIVNTYKALNYWNFNITKTHIGIFMYPRWTLFWLEWIVRKIKNIKHKEGELND